MRDTDPARAVSENRYMIPESPYDPDEDKTIVIIKGEKDMISQEVLVHNPSGLHLCPAGVLCRETIKFNSQIELDNGSMRVNAKSVLNILSACIKCGDTITVICEGADEEEAMKKVVDLINSGLEEV